MSTDPGNNKIAAMRLAEQERLARLPVFPRQRPEDERGVLLSDRIKHYATTYDLIAPFDDKLLRPAGYDLTVGRCFSIRGQQGALREGMQLEIGPYQVAIIETYETINMPEFLIGRWNIRVKLAYKGLLWVGAAQVDPGFRGHLCCPIYNLSMDAVRLSFREELASIDFVTTTTFQDGACLKFPWRDRKMVVFQDYPLVNSGIEEEVLKFKKAIEEGKTETREDLTKASAASAQSFRETEKRIDTFVSLVFMVVAVLFTGLGIVATKGSSDPSFWSPPVWLAAVALFFALRAHDHSSLEGSQGKWYTRLVPGVLLLLTGLIVIVGLFFDGYQARVSTNELREARERATKAMTALDQERKDRGAQILELQRRIDQLQKNQIPPK